MGAFKSAVAVRSDAFRQNTEAMEALVAGTEIVRRELGVA